MLDISNQSPIDFGIKYNEVWGNEVIMEAFTNWRPTLSKTLFFKKYRKNLEVSIEEFDLFLKNLLEKLVKGNQKLVEEMEEYFWSILGDLGEQETFNYELITHMDAYPNLPVNWMGIYRKCMTKMLRKEGMNL
jgi:hypothetical protein